MKKIIISLFIITSMVASMCVSINAQAPEEYFEPVPEEFVTEITMEEVAINNENLGEVSPAFIIIPPMILYQYDREVEYLGEMYFPNQPFETLHNGTSSVMQISDTFTTTASVKVVGSVSVSMEDYFETNLGFDYEYTNTFSRNINMQLNPGQSLYLYVSYATYLVTEVKMPIATFDDPSTYTTSYLYVHKPVGLYYKN